MATKKRKVETGLRLDRKLWQRLRKSARKNNLSINQETVRRVEESFRRDRLKNIEDKINELWLSQ